MGCVSLSDAVAEVGKHLLGDDWIGYEISAPALNIGGQRDRDTATAIKARQFALLEEQEGRMAVMFWRQQIAEDLDPEPLPELSKDNLADVEKALAKKWEGEKEARNRLESATAWLGRRLYGTPPDYGDAVPSYIPSPYGELWRLAIGFWNKHSVQEVLFTEVEYLPGDYGQKSSWGAGPLKGRVLILQEALREAITRDRPINQTDSGIDATASVEEGVADGSSSHSADNLPDKQASRVGRPTLNTEIEAADKEFPDAGKQEKSKRRKTRRPEPQIDAEVKSKIIAVLSAADNKWPTAQELPPTAYQAAGLLVAGKPGKRLFGYSEVTVKKILAGTYSSMSKHGLTGRY